MKKVIAITCILILCVISSSFAAAGNWRFWIYAENTDGMFQSTTTIGVSGTAANVEAPYGADLSNSVAWAPVMLAGVGHTSAFNRTDFGSWTIHMSGSRNIEGNQMQLRIATLTSSAALPPAQVGGEDVIYKLTLVNNRGVAGAPANGTSWVIPGFATAGNTNVWTSPALPVIKPTSGSSMTDTWLLNNGYVFEFTAGTEVIPEPSSLLALGGGLMGLAGFVARRRRA